MRERSFDGDLHLELATFKYTRWAADLSDEQLKVALSPPRYDWDVQLPEPPVAMPGVTQFV